MFPALVGVGVKPILSTRPSAAASIDSSVSRVCSACIFREARRRVDGDDLASRDDRDGVGQELGFLHVVGREKDRLPAVLEALEHIPDLPSRVRVEPGRGFVEKDDLGIVDERGGDPEALLEAAGEGVEAGVGLAAQIGEVHQGVDVGVASEYPRVVPQALAHGDPVERAEVLREHADPPDDLGLGPGDVQPEHGDLSRRRIADRFDDLDRDALAGAVGAEERENLALVDGERNVVDRKEGTVTLAEPVHHDRVFGVRHEVAPSFPCDSRGRRARASRALRRPRRRCP